MGIHEIGYCPKKDTMKLKMVSDSEIDSDPKKWNSEMPIKPLSFTDYLRKNPGAMADFIRHKSELQRVIALLDIDFESADDVANDAGIENAVGGTREFLVSFANFVNKSQQETIKNTAQLVESSEYIGPETVKRNVRDLMRFEKLLDEIRKPNRVRIERTLRSAEEKIEALER